MYGRNRWCKKRENMKGYQLLQMINLDREGSKTFGGLYAIDQLNFNFPNRDVYYICNTDRYENRGKHWIVIYNKKDSSYIEYFDSLGHKPNNKFINFMSQSKKNILYNKKRLQSRISKACGYFCLYFIYLRCRNVDFYSILDNFSSDVQNNEKYVVDFIHNSFFNL